MSKSLERRIEKIEQQNITDIDHYYYKLAREYDPDFHGTVIEFILFCIEHWKKDSEPQ